MLGPRGIRSIPKTDVNVRLMILVVLILTRRLFEAIDPSENFLFAVVLINNQTV